MLAENQLQEMTEMPTDMEEEDDHENEGTRRRYVRISKMPPQIR